MRKLSIEIVLLIAMIWGPSFYVQHKAKALADKQFGKGDYCWVAPDYLSKYYITVLPDDDIDVRFWRDITGISRLGELVGLRRPHFGLVVPHPSEDQELAYGWSYGSMSFYSSYSLSLLIGENHREECQKVLEDSHAD